MKKNNMLRIASVLLVAVLLSTCAISGAFAKYYTSGTATDSARVAAFGINVNVEGNGAAFSRWYRDTAVESTDNTATVVGAAKVIAPGTNGDLGSFGITGTAEVDVTVAKSVTLTLTGFDTYCPIVIWVGEDPYYVGQDGIDDAGDLANAVSTALSGTTIVQATESAAASAEYSWEWVFDNTDPRLAADGDLEGLNINDASDTALASAAYDAINDTDDTTNAPTIALAVSITVTQID